MSARAARWALCLLLGGTLGVLSGGLMLEELTPEEMMALPQEQLVAAIVAARSAGTGPHVANYEARAVSPLSVADGRYR